MRNWKYSILIPAFLISSALAWPVSGLAKKSGLAAASVTKADIIGFWSIDNDMGGGITVKSQAFFGTDNILEGRGAVSFNGTTTVVNSFETWTFRNDTIFAKPIAGRCKTQGNFAEDCGGSSSDTITVVMRDGVKTLIDFSEGTETEVGKFVGTQKLFTITDLFASSSLVRGGDVKAAAQRSRIAVSGSGAGSVGGFVPGFDLTGRISGARMASGFHATVPENR